MCISTEILDDLKGYLGYLFINAEDGQLPDYDLAWDFLLDQGIEYSDTRNNQVATILNEVIA
tara:strand:+ start:3143 stop:3328 length:186 start_codon:yes stop_codon:yes gene_type:complete